MDCAFVTYFFFMILLSDLEPNCFNSPIDPIPDIVANPCINPSVNFPAGVNGNPAILLLVIMIILMVLAYIYNIILFIL